MKCCTKRPFASRLEADLALSRISCASAIERRQGNRKRPHRRYCCELCGSWHLTSQPEEADR